MKTYEADGYTFTEEELKGDNPYLGADGAPMKGCGTKFFAFNDARFQYRLDQMTEDERRKTLEARERFERKMASSGPVFL